MDGGQDRQLSGPGVIDRGTSPSDDCQSRKLQVCLLDEYRFTITSFELPWFRKCQREVGPSVSPLEQRSLNYSEFLMINVFGEIFNRSRLEATSWLCRAADHGSTHDSLILVRPVRLKRL